MKMPIEIPFRPLWMPSENVRKARNCDTCRYFYMGRLQATSWANVIYNVPFCIADHCPRKGVKGWTERTSRRCTANA